MSGQIFEGATVEEALQKAATELGVEVSDLEHEAAADQGGDFWGLGEPSVSVSAWVRAADEDAVVTPPAEAEEPGGTGVRSTGATPAAEPEAEPQSEEESVGASEADPPADSEANTQPANEPSSFFAPAPDRDASPSAEPEPEPARESGPAAGTAEAAESPPASVEASDEGASSTQEPGARRVESAAAGEAAAPENIEEATVALLNRIFGAMDFDCTAEARVDGEALLVAISGDDNQYLLDGRGRGLSALELILNHAFRHRAGDEHKKIHVDAGDFRARREDEIRDLAYQVSHQAKETGTEQETQPLNPYERRIVHLTLADDEQVTTRSRGAGFMKSVSIIPTTRGRR